MNRKNFLRRIGGFILAAIFLTEISFSSGNTTVQAQGRRVIIVRPVRVYRPYPSWWYGYRRPFGWDDSYYYSQYVFRNGEAAYQQSYHDGFKTGSEDGRKRKSYDPERSHYFHDAGFGNFAEAYREGFALGYRNGCGPA